MKVLHTADWHIGQFKGPVEDGVNLRSLDTVKCLEYMVEKAKEEKPDLVCISGDVFHQEQIGPVRYSDEMVTATRIIDELSKVSKFVVVMRGTPNHDGAGQFRVLTKMLEHNKKVAVVTTPQVISTPIADIVCIPGFDKQEFRAKFPGLSAEEENLTWTNHISEMVMGLRAQCSQTNIVADMVPAILMAHYTVPGCNMESGQTSFFSNFEPVIPREALQTAQFDAVLLGHIHRPQMLEGLENVFYSGAINAMNFNDEGQKRGFWIHEFEKKSLKKGHLYETPYRKFQTIKWDKEDVAEYLRSGKMYLLEKDYASSCMDAMSYLYHYINEKLFEKTVRRGKEKLTRLVSHVMIYMDDIVVFGGNKKHIHKAMEMIVAFTRDFLGLVIKPTWQKFLVSYKTNQGKTKGRNLDFMGFVFCGMEAFYRIYDGTKKRLKRVKVIVRDSIFLRGRRKFSKLIKKIKNRRTVSKHYAMSLLAYHGWIKNTDSFQFQSSVMWKEIIGIARNIVSRSEKGKPYTCDKYYQKWRTLYA